MINLLVTGGAGFIGSHYIKYVLAHNEDVNIINADSLSYSANLYNLKEVENDPRYSFTKVDLANSLEIDRLFEQKIDQIVHFAAESHVDRSISCADNFIQANIIGTYRLLEKAKDSNIARFVHISTDEVYGSFPEGSADELTTLSPGNPYAASKASSDLLALAYYNTYNIPVIITRCTNNYGPNQHSEKFIPNTVYKLLYNQPAPIYGDGSQERDWLHVIDHCRAVELIRREGELGEIYHIGAEDPKKNIAIAREIADILGKPHTLLEHVTDRLGHDIRYCLDTSKLKNSLKWKPSIKFKDGLVETVEWYVKLLAT